MSGAADSWSASSAVFAEGQVLEGKFRVLRLLGEGGMGAVYEVEHVLTKHRRALKTLHASLRQNPAVVARFLREASAAGRIGSPHIVETFDAGTLATGEPFLVMEFVKGETLASVLERRGRLRFEEICEVMIQACEGVQAAHDAGIVHRDLKPDNLYLADREGRPFVKLLDFGVSKFEAGTTGELAMTSEGAALGTPYYMSPEQMLGKADVDARSDVYALGVILYECAAGIRPYDADTLPALAVKVVAGGAPALDPSRLGVPQAFCELVQRALAPQKEQRLATARELRDELVRLVGGGAGLTAVERHSGPGATLLLDGPAASPLTVASPGAEPARDASTGAISAHTATPLTAVSPAAPQAPGSRAPLIAAGALLLAAGIGFMAWRGSASPTAEPTTSSAPARAASASEPAVTPIAVAATTAAVVASPPSAATPSPSGASAPAKPGAGAAAKSAAPRTAAEASSKPNVTEPAPKPGQPSKRPGLAEDNPF